MIAIMDLVIHTPSKMTFAGVILSLLLVPLAAFAPVSATGGSFQLKFGLAGIWTVTLSGELQNGVIQSDNSVSMTMVLNDQIQTAIGPVQVSINGILNGVKSGSALSGTIQGMVGKVSAMGFSGDFVGQGQWNGSLAGSHGTGTMTGTVTFTNSPVPQISTNQPYPISGTWDSDFSIAVPEFGSTLPTYMILFATTIFLIIYLNGQQRSKDRHRARSLTSE
jgi:hypothetical protein